MNMSKEEIKEKIKELNDKIEKLKAESDYYNATQNALKIILNGSYGAFTTPYFVLYHKSVGASITAQGRDLIQRMDKVNEKYWYDIWHTDTNIHEKMNIRNVTPLDKDKDKVSIYCDTDSVSGTSKIWTTSGLKSIEEWYDENINNTSDSTLKGHESVFTTDKVLNFDKGLYFAPVKRIIKHKVNKPKWVLKTDNGKSIEVTDDHSMIVFRNNEKIEVKPSEILMTDEILTISVK